MTESECPGIVHGESKGSPSKWSPRSQAFAVSESWMRPSVTTWRSGMQTSVCCCCGFEIKTDLENSRDMTPYRAHGPESHFLRHTICFRFNMRANTWADHCDLRTVWNFYGLTLSDVYKCDGALPDVNLVSTEAVLRPACLLVQNLLPDYEAISWLGVFLMLRFRILFAWSYVVCMWCVATESWYWHFAFVRLECNIQLAMSPH